MGTSKLWHCPRGESGILGVSPEAPGAQSIWSTKKPPIARHSRSSFPFTRLGDRYATAPGTTIKFGRITPQGSIGLILTTTAPRCGRGWEDSDGCRPKTSCGCTYFLAQESCLIPSLLSYRPADIPTCFSLYATFLLKYVYRNILYMYK